MPKRLTALGFAFRRFEVPGRVGARVFGLNIGCRYSTPVCKRPLHPTRSQFKPEASQTQAPVTPATEPERRAGGGLTTVVRVGLANRRFPLRPRWPFRCARRRPAGRGRRHGRIAGSSWGRRARACARRWAGERPGDGLAGNGMPEIVQADVVETGFLPCPAPEVQCVRKRFVRMPRGREHVKTCGTRLAGEDGLRGLAQPDPSRAGLGVA